MPVCPICKSRYPEGTAVCPNCQVMLADEAQWRRPHAAEPGGEAWAELEGLDASLPPEIIKDILEQNGVPCMMRGHYYDANFRNRGDRELKLLVPASRLAEARELIEAFARAPESQPQLRACPHCGGWIEDYRIKCPNCRKPTGW